MSKMVVTKKDEDVPEEVTLAKNFMLKEFSEAFQNTESKRDAMLEPDPHLERRMIICQGIEKILTLYHKLSNRK